GRGAGRGGPAARRGARSPPLGSCALGGEPLALSAELAAQTESRVESPPLTLLRSRRQQLGAAAVAISALAAGLVLTLSQHDASPARTPGTPEVIAPRREAAGPDAIRAISPAEQPRTDIRLAWPPVDRAIRYRVQVSREDLQPLFDRTVEQATSLAVPPAIGERGAPVPGGAVPARPSLLHWQVDAILP